MAGQLDEAAKQILGTLLEDFTSRGLGADDLNSYEGPQIQDLSAAVCNVDDITSVDFDIAFADLEKANLIQTGPLVPFANDPYSSLIMIGSYSKREYAHLTQEGYKAARKAPNRPQQRVQRVVNHVNISGGNFSNLQLAAGESVKQSMTVSSGTDAEIIAKLIAILEEQGQQVSDEQRAGIQTAVAVANEGDGKEAKSLLTKVCGPLWESVQPVMWPIVGELVKKSLGL
ncbi:hypothetical protein [Dickeya fangzhongdai]|uniref:hypothetical protein n=1 Tax=Dickeya fangzhongdai TaxID=1778540 RepID=UPI0023E41C04|nr:hypothetical protein [Dickeya fangzhongdai]WES90507.1 hypothetical protein PQ617_08420 [Dickeya fangzhongdai]